MMQLRPRAARLRLCADARADERPDGPADGDADARADGSRDTQPGDGVPDDAPDAHVRARPRLRDLAHPPAHMCAGTGPTPVHKCTGTAHPCPHLRRNLTTCAQANRSSVGIADAAAYFTDTAADGTAL